MATAARIFSRKPISPLIEMGAYEHLWLQDKSSVKSIANLFRDNLGATPSDLVDHETAKASSELALAEIDKADIGRFGVRVHGASQYPASLRDASDPVELLYYQGSWELTESSRRVAIVGSRKASPRGKAQAREITKELVERNYTIVSGLADGIDTVALETAIEFGGSVIAVIGTPITDVYPAKNAELQRQIARKHLLISQVPILKYKRQNWRVNRFFFPERNKTMSALTQATVIAEAGETSGTLIQARAAIAQGRKLFILDNCYQNSAINWPEKYSEKGAIRVRSIDDIKWGLDGI